MKFVWRFVIRKWQTSSKQWKIILFLWFKRVIEINSEGKCSEYNLVCITISSSYHFAQRVVERRLQTTQHNKCRHSRRFFRICAGECDKCLAKYFKRIHNKAHFHSQWLLSNRKKKESEKNGKSWFDLMLKPERLKERATFVWRFLCVCRWWWSKKCE